MGIKIRLRIEDLRLKRNVKKTFTLEELKKFDGKDGRLCYVAYKGFVYDVTESPLFENGRHYEHFAGCDLTREMENAPHKDEVFRKYRIVGKIFIKS
jgi:predicted heme/steroid binding protein